MAARSVAALLFGSFAGCTTQAFVVGQTPRGQDIVEIATPLSNVYLITSNPPVLIDSGANGDYDAVSRALGEYGTSPERVALVILTHGHADHAATAAQFQLLHAQIMLGQGDLDLATHGHNDELRPMYFTARVLELFLPSRYPPFMPDVLVQKPVDLSAWGIDGTVEQMPGHTRGSLVVILSNKAAFVGDMVLGGSMGGAISPTSPGEHYFHADPDANARNIETLTERGVETFYLGHGGPVTRADVIEAFDIHRSATDAGDARNERTRSPRRLTWVAADRLSLAPDM